MYIRKISTDYHYQHPLKLTFKGNDLTDLIKEQTLTSGDINIYNRFNSDKIYLSVKNKGDFINKGIDVYETKNKKYVTTLQPINEKWCSFIGPDEIFYEITDLSKDNTKYTFDINGLNLNFNLRDNNYEARMALKSKYHGTTFNVIQPGRTRGKFLNVKGKDIDEVIRNLKEPVILYIDSYHAEMLLSQHCPNIKGLIIESINTFVPQTAHLSSEYRAMTDVCIVTDPLKTIVPNKMDGEYIDLAVGSNGNYSYRKISPKQVLDDSVKAAADAKIPKFNTEKKTILLPEECTSDVIGAKAVNLNRLKKLAEKGILDVKIPPFIGLPYGYIVNMYASNPCKLKNFDQIAEPYLQVAPYNVCQKDNYCNNLMNELKKVLKANNIDSEEVMVRSSFNVEDLPRINTAGIFDSMESSYENSDLFRTISMVASKIQRLVPAFAKRYNIPMDNIQPGVVLQKKIDTDYKFTIYTDDGQGNLIMDLMQKNSQGYYFNEEVAPSCKITYNKARQIMKIQPNLNNTMTKRSVTGKISDTISLSYMHEMYLYNTSVFQDTLKKIIRNALVTEKEFGGPQDIEGGFNINRFNSLLMKAKAACQMTNKAYIPKMKNVHTAEKIITTVVAILSGTIFGSVIAGIYGFLGTAVACLTFNNIEYLKHVQKFQNLYSASATNRMVKEVINNNNIYFWQTRHVVDLLKKIR